MRKQSIILYALGFLMIAVMALVITLTVSVMDVQSVSGEPSAEKPRLDLPDDIPWDKIPWREFPENFPWDEVPWEDMPENTDWENVPWESVPWEKLPDDIPAELPWEEIPWEELPEDFPYDKVPWDDLPDDFNWKAVTCEHDFEWSRTVLPPSCIKVGADLYTCNLCGLEQLRETDPTGVHHYDANTGKCETCDRQQLTVQGCSLSEEYNGTPLMVSDPEDYQILFGSLKKGHKASCIYSDSLTKVGTVTNRFTVKILDESGTDVTDGYELTLRTGTLTVTPKSITVETLSAEATFSEGISLYCNQIQPVKLAAEDEIKIVRYTTIDQEGSCDNIIEIKIVNRDGEDVTDCYAVAWIWGRLTLKRD